MKMKKWMGGAGWTAALAALPQTALADGETVPSRQVILGGDRIAACWILAVCAVSFVVLVCIWSVGLKRKAAQNRLMQTQVRPQRRK